MLNLVIQYTLLKTVRVMIFINKTCIDYGSCHKVWSRGGRKGFDRVIKLLHGKCWANKLLQVTNMGHEAKFVSRFAFNVLQLF